MCGEWHAGLQRREVLAGHVDLHRARYLHHARVLSDHLDEAFLGWTATDTRVVTEQASSRHVRCGSRRVGLPKYKVDDGAGLPSVL